MTTITEADVEQAALDWLQGLGWGAFGTQAVSAKVVRSLPMKEERLGD